MKIEDFFTKTKLSSYYSFCRAIKLVIFLGWMRDFQKLKEKMSRKGGKVQIPLLYMELE